jgi:hypothetical protein
MHHRADVVDALLDTGRFAHLATDHHDQTALDWALGVGDSHEMVGAEPVRSGVVTDLLDAAVLAAAERGDETTREWWPSDMRTIMRSLLSHPSGLMVTERTQAAHSWARRLRHTLQANQRLYRDPITAHVLPAVWLAVAQGSWTRRAPAVVACYVIA